MALVTIVLYDTPDGQIVLRTFSEPPFRPRNIDAHTEAQIAGLRALDAIAEHGNVESIEAVKGY